MKIVENLKKVALVLFIILGISHIIAGLMLSKNYFLPYSLIANRVLDIPFAITAVIYGFSSLYLKTNEKLQKISGPVYIILSLLIFILLIYINLFIPDKTPLNLI